MATKIKPPARPRIPARGVRAAAHPILPYVDPTGDEAARLADAAGRRADLRHLLDQIPPKLRPAHA